MSAVAVIVFILVVIGVLSGGKGKRRRYAARRNPNAASRPARPVTVPEVPRNHVSSIVQQGPNAARSPPEPAFDWHPPGTSPMVAGHLIRGGMVYVGRTAAYQRDGNCCIIDPSLSVASVGVEENLGYWPSYRDISPSCRLTYLRWLSGGKCAPDIDAGHVFLYFYGLERRLLVDRPPPSEEALLVAEVARLRSIYSGNRSFNGYSRGLLEAVETARLLGDAASARAFQPDLGLPGGGMSLPLKVAIAKKVAADEPLQFELAAAGLIGLAWDVWPRNPLVMERARGAFLQMLRARFEKSFPLGFRLRNRKDSRLRLEYQAASAGLRVDLIALVKRERMPDPTTLTWTKLIELATQVTNELEPYAKMLAYYPERANSLTALAVCPPELVSSIAVEARTWLDGLPSPMAAVRFADLVQRATGAKTAKWTLRHHRSVSEALSNMGRGMEPDPSDGSAHLEDTTEVQVIDEPACLSPRSPSFRVAAAAAVVVAGVARASGGRTAIVEQTWLEQVQLRLGLPPGEVLRLLARLRWLRGSSAGLARAKRLLAGGSPADLETAAWSAAVAAAAGGLIDKPQVAMLEAIYDKLEVPRRSLYTTIHGAAAASAIPASEPVTVTTDAPANLHPIPRPVRPESPGLDQERLRQVRRETERVSSVLAEIFVEEEATPSQLVAGEDAGHAYPGLDTVHAALVERLIANPSWPRAEFEMAAREAGLMPDGSLEAINEWAFERFDEPLLEDGETLTVNISLLRPAIERVDAA